jgi:hypothetical protein
MNIDKLREAAKALQFAMRLFDSGPLDYHLLELSAAYELLMSRYAPFKVGDRVRLLRAPDFNKSPGWRGCEHFLVAGANGEVRTAECGSDGFRFGVVFDEESWVNCHDQSVHPIGEGNRHQFSFGEGWLEHEVTTEMEELPRWKPTVTISDRQVREAEMEKRIVELVAELAKTIASHQRQNKVCEEYEEENEQLRVRITELEEASKA